MKLHKQLLGEVRGYESRALHAGALSLARENPGCLAHLGGATDQFSNQLFAATPWKDCPFTPT